jgi:hypothetical protein
LLPFGLLVVWGLWRATYNEFREIEEERDDARAALSSRAGDPPAFIRAGAVSDVEFLDSELNLRGSFIEAGGDVSGVRGERSRFGPSESQLRIVRPEGTAPDCTGVAGKCADLSRRILDFLAGYERRQTELDPVHARDAYTAQARRIGDEIMTTYGGTFAAEVEFVFDELMECAYVAEDWRSWFTHPVNPLRVHDIATRLGAIALRMKQNRGER